MALDGAPPSPVSVSLASSTSDDATYTLGSLVQLVVAFDKNVSVDGSPVLVLDCSRMREALFYGGNGSRALHFQYEVCSVSHLYLITCIACPTRIWYAVSKYKARVSKQICATVFVGAEQCTVI